jgi:1,4-dihydroxy-6-naphthoate synthase
LLIRLGHSPDPDDAFMFHALANDKIDTGNLTFRHELQDIETLNRRALRGELEVTAISIHAYSQLLDKYALLPSGCSMGDRYGPMVVARKPMKIDELAQCKIAVPGTMTTAFLALRLLLAPNTTGGLRGAGLGGETGFQYEVVPFDQILNAVAAGKYDAGLIIHEGQLTYDQSGLHRIVDLGKWWQKMTGLPLALGGNAIRRSLGRELISSVSTALRESIQYALDHREEALAYAMQFARDLDPQMADRFVGMYVNERTLDYGPDGKEAIRRLLDMGYRAGIISVEPTVEFVE